MLDPRQRSQDEAKEHQLERCGSEPPFEQILILDTVSAYHLYALFFGPSPFILFILLFLPLLLLPGCAVLTATLLAVVPTSGGQKSALDHSPHFQRTGQLHHPPWLPPCFSSKSFLSIPLSRNNLKNCCLGDLEENCPGSLFLAPAQYRRKHFQHTLAHGISLCPSDSHLGAAHPYASELTPVTNRAMFNPHVPAIKLAGSPYLSCLQGRRIQA